MTTNILLLERAAANANGGSLVADFDTATNADWRDSVAYVVADAIVPTYPSPSTTGSANVGAGTFSALSVDANAAPGVYVLTISDIIGGVTYFTVQDTAQALLGRGAIGVGFAQGGISLTLNAGAVPWVVGDAVLLQVTARPLDLTGITFVRTLRPVLNGAARYTANVALSLTTDPTAPVNPATLSNGGAGGVVSASVPRALMAALPPSAPGTPTYDYDDVATDGTTVIRTYRGQIYHAPGVS